MSTSTKVIENKLAELKQTEKILKSLNYTTIGLAIRYVYDEESKTYEKKIIIDKPWKNGIKLTKNHNALAVTTGKKSGFFVIHINDIIEWNMMLKDMKRTEPNTVKVLVDINKMYYYFKYEEKLDQIKGRDMIFTYKKLKIYVKINDNIAIIPPSYYHDAKLEKDNCYKWEKSLLENEPSMMPTWLFELLTSIKDKQVNFNINNDNENCIDKEDTYSLVGMLNYERCFIYQTWINVGMCLYNIDDKSVQLWDGWCKMDNNYKKGKCEKKWKTFTKNEKGLNIKNLIMWEKEDSPEEFNEYCKKKKQIMKIVECYRNKFPKNKLIITYIIITLIDFSVYLSDEYCPIMGGNHVGEWLYLRGTESGYVMRCYKCKHKHYPKDYIRTNQLEIFFSDHFNDSVLL